MTEERTGEAFELGEQLTVVGRQLQAGDRAPGFVLDEFDGETMSSVRLGDTTGLVRVLTTVNSLDTPVCEVETRRWEQLREEVPADLVLYTVSMDLPFAQARWRTSAGVGHALLSSHRGEDFGREYGVLIMEWRLLQRAVFVIDRDDNVAYAEYVGDQMAEPDYKAALDAALACLRHRDG
jgi:thioredoxin-dependent peroxiredoxin